MASPALVIEPDLSVSPDWYRPGVRPKLAQTAIELLNRVGSSITARKVIAMAAPTPGTDMTWRQTISSRARSLQQALDCRQSTHEPAHRAGREHRPETEGQIRAAVPGCCYPNPSSGAQVFHVQTIAAANPGPQVFSNDPVDTNPCTASSQCRRRPFDPS